MPSVTYKCPNCGSGLIFSPEKQLFQCEYCRSEFTEAELENQTPPTPASAPATETLPQKTDAASAEERIALFTCPSCGGEIIGDETTAATSCIYCHNPVIMSGQLSGNWKPDAIIPFAFDRDDVKKRLIAWAKSHMFIESGFIGEASMDHLQGIYYPFWVVDGKVRGRMRATGVNVRTWRSGDTRYTETTRYDIRREGDFDFSDMELKAVSKQAARMVDGIYPFQAAKALDFSMPYLSGFLAERRSMEKKDLAEEAAGLIDQAGRSFFRGTISGYASVTVNEFSLSNLNDSWRYALMPVWLMTYQFRGENFFFAMNGQTGKVAGRVPVSRRKLGVLFAAVSIAVAALAMVILRTQS